MAIIKITTNTVDNNATLQQTGATNDGTTNILEIYNSDNVLVFRIDSLGRFFNVQSFPSALTNNLGLWDANANTPAIASGVGNAGDFYQVSVGGTTDIDGINVWGVDDYIWFDGSTNTWQRIIGGGQSLPGGLNKQIQFNDNGNFAGDPNLI